MKLFSKNIDENISRLEETFSDMYDIVKRKFPIGENKDIWIYVIYIDILTGRDVIEEAIINSLMIEIRKTPPDNIKNNIYSSIKDGGITTADFKETDDFDTAVNEILAGNTLVLIDGYETGLIISTKGWPKRGVSEAETEIVIQGSKESFSETISVNTSLVRRRIRDTNFKTVLMSIGKRSKTDVEIMYIKDIVRTEILEEVKKRLNEIDIDAILDSGYIEQFIEDDYLSPFPQLQMTERPDKAASAVLEGRIVLIVDNSPFAIILPTVLSSFYQSSEDYYQRWEIMSLIRLIRYVAGFIAVALPGFYVAATVFHPSMIPSELLFKMAQARGEVPLPTVLEVFMMEIAFETLREAGIRLPSAIGSTLGIVGGIIIGQSAVDAGLVSPLVVIVVALTAICSFAIPNVGLVSAYRLVKYFILLFSAVLGFYGFAASILAVLVHLASLKSFSIPYLYPFVSLTPENSSGLKDTVIKPPLTDMPERGIFASKSQKYRMKKR